MPAKRARGTYAKLICLRCRERRIKCQLLDDGSVVPSPDPQPPEKACQRCQQQGLECIVRKTTLGRPSQNRQVTMPTPSSMDRAPVESRPPSPSAEDLVLLNFEEGSESATERTAVASNTGHHDNYRRNTTVQQRPTSAQLLGALDETFDLTSAFLARDSRFGSSIVELRETMPRKITDVISDDVAIILDQHLLWYRLYMPWIPSLPTLLAEISLPEIDSGPSLSAKLVLALLSSIALDVPSERTPSEWRQKQRDLRCVIYHTGQKLLFTLPRHEYTLMALELVHSHRPLSLITSHQAAAHTLSGKLYPTLINALLQQLGLDTAPAKLRDCLDGDVNDGTQELVLNTLRWCASTIFHLGQDLSEVEAIHSTKHPPSIAVEQALDAVASSLERGQALSDCFFLYHTLRYYADDLKTQRDLTADWKEDLSKFASHIQAHESLRDQRKKNFDDGLAFWFINKGRTDEAVALSQLSNMELNLGRNQVVGVALLFAIVSGAQNKLEGSRNPIIKLSKYYTDAVLSGSSTEEQSDKRDFLGQYGDAHIDGLEQRLTDFINVATDVRLQGLKFVGPPRATTTNILMACKEIVENNAVRVRLEGQLHHRVGMQLILFQEAARRLEEMEADGGTSDAVARGSIFATSSKLIRSLHRILSQWKRSYLTRQNPQDGAASKADDTCFGFTLDGNLVPGAAQFPSGDSNDFFGEGFFADWNNWPQLDATELSNMLNYDFDPSML